MLHRIQRLSTVSQLLRLRVDSDCESENPFVRIPQRDHDLKFVRQGFAPRRIVANRSHVENEDLLCNCLPKSVPPLEHGLRRVRVVRWTDPSLLVDVLANYGLTQSLDFDRANSGSSRPEMHQTAKG